MRDYLKYYDLERYVFEEVHRRFHAEHSVGAFDFFSIVIWKANRAKSRIAAKLLAGDAERRRDLDAIARTLTSALSEAANAKERLRLLIVDWKFALPMASAILAVFWPEEFTIYDYRVRQRLSFPELKHLADFNRIWDGFTDYQMKVAAIAPAELNLRDKDRFFGENRRLCSWSAISEACSREPTARRPSRRVAIGPSLLRLGNPNPAGRSCPGTSEQQRDVDRLRRQLAG